VLGVFGWVCLGCWGDDERALRSLGYSED